MLGLPFSIVKRKGRTPSQHTICSKNKNTSNSVTHLVIAISRAFAAHNQIVSCILKHDGDKNYLSVRGGMSFVIRRMYLTDEEGEGVIPVPMAMVEGETVQAQVVNERRAKGLKYDEPAMSDLVDAALKKEMKVFLLDNMNRMDDEVVKYWMERVDDDEDVAEYWQQMIDEPELMDDDDADGAEWSAENFAEEML